MDFYVIPPNSQLELMNQGDRYFCLAQHYYNNEEYRKFFKSRKEEGKWVTLDNGAGDHSLITEDVLMWCLKDLMPSEVVPPDFLFDKDKTIGALCMFVDKLKQEDLINKVEIFAVPQGASQEEWLSCYNYMLQSYRVSTIGMSKLGIPHAWLGEAKNDQGIKEARQQCVEYLINNNLIQKPLHFLGMGDPTEMISYRLYNTLLDKPLFRSTDSCNSVLSGMLGYSWEEKNFKRDKTPLDYFERTMTDKQLSLAKKNIEWFKNILK